MSKLQIKLSWKMALLFSRKKGFPASLIGYFPRKNPGLLFIVLILHYFRRKATFYLGKIHFWLTFCCRKIDTTQWFIIMNLRKFHQFWLKLPFLWIFFCHVGVINDNIVRFFGFPKPANPPNWLFFNLSNYKLRFFKKYQFFHGII